MKSTFELDMLRLEYSRGKTPCASREYLKKPAHPRKLIRDFTVLLKTLWVLVYLQSAVRRLWSDFTEAQADLCFQWAQYQSSSKCFAGSFMIDVILCVLYAGINCLHVHVICFGYASVNTSRISVSGCEYADGMHLEIYKVPCCRRRAFPQPTPALQQIEDFYFL